METFNWIKVISLLIAVGLGLAACEAVKPIAMYQSELTLSAPTTSVNGGTTFTLTTTLSYQDESGIERPLANQAVYFEGGEFGISGQVTTDANGAIAIEVSAPLLPEREKERDAWIRVQYNGTVIEFAERIGRFSDANNSRYFNIKQSAPGRNNPGIPGAE